MEIIREEIEGIDPRFRDDAVSLILKRGLNLQGTTKDITFYYPFWLGFSFEHPNKDEVVIRLTRFNFWFGIHILAQDDLVDRQTGEGDPYRNIILSDYFLLRSMLHLGDLMRYHSINPIEGTKGLYEDYINCLFWEKENLNSPSHRYSKSDLEMLGKKFAPLMVDNVILSCLKGSNMDLMDLNSFLNNYHIYLQIMDDMKDWKDDLRNGNFTYFLNEMIQRYNLKGSVEEMEEFEYIIGYSDITKRMAETSMEYLCLASSCIRQIENPYLNEFLEEEKRRAEAIISNNEMRIESIIKDVRLILLKD
jgi:hypothetical protein